MQPAPRWPPRWDTPIFQEGDGEIPDASHSWFAQGVDCGSFKMALDICSGTQGPFLAPRGKHRCGHGALQWEGCAIAAWPSEPHRGLWEDGMEWNAQLPDLQQKVKFEDEGIESG